MKRILSAVILLLAVHSTVFAADLVLDSSEQAVYQGKLDSGLSLLSFDLDLEMPVSEETVPLFKLIGPNKKEEALFTLTISDIQCTGEYEADISFLPNKEQIQASYFKTRVPWPETIEVRMEANIKTSKGYQHIISINGERRELTTWKKIKPFELSVEGKAAVTNLTVAKKEK